MTQRDSDIEGMSREQLQNELQRTRNVIRDVHSQRADDCCWLDIDRIFKAIGLPVPDRRVGDKAAMLQNCARYLDVMCQGGEWRSYAELEEDLERAKLRFALMTEDRDNYYNKLQAAYTRITMITTVAGHLRPDDLREAAFWIVPAPHVTMDEPQESKDAKVAARNREIDRVEKIMKLFLERQFQLLREENDKLKRDLAHKQAEHADLVHRNQIFQQRLDLPVDRIPAHDQLVKLQAFKARTHELLDVIGVPACTGAECRIGARLGWVSSIVEESRRLAERLHAIGESKNWEDGDQTDRVYGWYEFTTLWTLLEAANEQRVPNL